MADYRLVVPVPTRYQTVRLLQGDRYDLQRYFFFFVGPYFFKQRPADLHFAGEGHLAHGLNGFFIVPGITCSAS